MKQDGGDQINPTMTGGGHLVLIWGQLYRTLLGDNSKPLSHRNQGHAHGRAQSKDTYIYGWTYRGEWHAYEQTNTYTNEIEVRIIHTVSDK